MLDSLNQGKYFTTWDLQSGFWLIALDADAKAKIAFVSHHGLFQFTKRPFGITAAPARFQRFMECVLAGLTGLIGLVLLDAVIIYTNADVFQHLYDILVALWVMLDAGL